MKSNKNFIILSSTFAEDYVARQPGFRDCQYVSWSVRTLGYRCVRE